MKTVSDYRNDKYLKEEKDEYLENKATERRNLKIDYRLTQIDIEIESIPDCLEQGFYDMAQTKINRIVDLREQIIDLRMNK